MKKILAKQLQIVGLMLILSGVVDLIMQSHLDAAFFLLGGFAYSVLYGLLLSKTENGNIR